MLLLKCSLSNIIWSYRRAFALSTTGLQKPLDVVFFGNDDFAVQCLKQLQDNLSKNLLHKKIINRLEVVCLPSADIPSKSVYSYAKSHHLPVYIWPHIPPASTFDVGLVASFGKLVPSSVIDSFRYGMLNVHPSLIPELRGAAPIARAIDAGFKSTGVTVLTVSPKRFDRGLVLAKSAEVLIDDDMFSFELSDKLAKIGGDMLVDCMINLPVMLHNSTAQDEIKATYAPKICEDDLYIDWNSLTANDVWNKYRAYGFNKSSCLRCFYNGKLVNGNLIKLTTLERAAVSDLPAELRPGEVVFDRKSRKLLIACKSGGVACSKLNIVGRRPQTAVDFYNGFMQTRIKRGEVILFQNT